MMRLLSRRRPVVSYCTEAPSAAFPTFCGLNLTRRSRAFHQAATAAITSSHSEVGKSAAAILIT
jgi:hypothetical protein